VCSKKSSGWVLALLFVFLSLPLSALESLDLESMDSASLWEKSEQVSMNLEALLRKQDLTLNELQTGVLELTTQFRALKADFETWKASLETLSEQSAALKMESARLETTMETLSVKLESLSASLTSLEDDMMKAQNRATWAMAGGITALVISIAAIVYVAVKSQAE
jgi:peptidoglycan hydrolase CwlO-like protein